MTNIEINGLYHKQMTLRFDEVWGYENFFLKRINRNVLQAFGVLPRLEVLLFSKTDMALQGVDQRNSSTTSIINNYFKRIGRPSETLDYRNR